MKNFSPVLDYLELSDWGGVEAADVHRHKLVADDVFGC